MRPYHPDNIKMTGHTYWRLAALAWAGKLLDIQFHVQGLPFGGSYRGPAADPSDNAPRTIIRRHPLANILNP